MKTPAVVPSLRLAAAMAGGLYMVIIAAGVWSEAVLRAPILVQDDPLSTLARLQSLQGWVRASIAADAVMLIADVALAVLLFRLLRPHGPALALTAMTFRLMQAAVLGANLLNLQAAMLLVDSGRGVIMLGEGAVAALATLRLQAHAEGYDLGLVFFGVNTLLTSVLLLRSRWAPCALSVLMVLAGVVYLVGSGLRILAPSLSEAFSPAYVLSLLAESAFCLWLLWLGLGHAIALHLRESARSSRQ